MNINDPVGFTIIIIIAALLFLVTRWWAWMIGGYVGAVLCVIAFIGAAVTFQVLAAFGFIVGAVVFFFIGNLAKDLHETAAMRGYPKSKKQEFDANKCQCKDKKGKPLNKCDECPR